MSNIKDVHIYGNGATLIFQGMPGLGARTDVRTVTFLLTELVLEALISMCWSSGVINSCLNSAT